MCLLAFGVEFEQFGYPFPCFGIAFAVGEHSGQIHQHALIVRHQLQSATVVLNGRIDFAQILPCHAPKKICFGDERIALQAGRSIGFRPCIVFQTDFGYSPIEIRLRHPRAQAYHLVEVPDAHHVVVEVESIAPDRDHPIDVYLRPSCGHGEQEQEEE